MTVATFSSREFMKDAGSVKKAAKHGLVFITDHGDPAHVLLNINDYLKLTGQDMTLTEAVAQVDVVAFEVEPPRAGAIVRPPDLS